MGDGVLDELDALLRDEAQDAHDEGLIRDVHPEAHLQVPLAQRLPLHRPGLEVARQERVELASQMSSSTPLRTPANFMRELWSVLAKNPPPPPTASLAYVGLTVVT